MPFTLHIEFTGLCLFAARGDAQPRMYVLMPAVLGDHHGTGLHVPVVRFDINRLRKDDPDRSGIYAQVLMRRREFVIPGGGASQDICSQIADLGRITGRQVDPTLLGSEPGGALTSRVTLFGGAMTEVARGECWEWDPGSYRRLAHRALWEIPDMPSDSLTLELRSMDGKPPEHITLYPQASESPQVLRIEVYHTPPEDLAPEPSSGRKPEANEYGWHFAEYYQLFGPQPAMRLPRYRPNSADCGSSTVGCPEWRDSGGLAFNCMLGGGG